MKIEEYTPNASESLSTLLLQILVRAKAVGGERRMELVEGLSCSKTSATERERERGRGGMERER